MGKIALINGSPRAPKSNSKLYAQIFTTYCPSKTTTFDITKNNHQDIWNSVKDCTDIVLVFPLYVDAIPVTMMNFLKSCTTYGVQKNQKIHCIINCGFLESQQNVVAVKIIELFCKQEGFIMGSCLCIGSGEAILKTPFAFLVKLKIKKLIKLIQKNQKTNLFVSMPLPKEVFIKASTKYWINLAKSNNISKEQMENMQIEE